MAMRAAASQQNALAVLRANYRSAGAHTRESSGFERQMPSRMPRHFLSAPGKLLFTAKTVRQDIEQARRRQLIGAAAQLLAGEYNISRKRENAARRCRKMHDASTIRCAMYDALYLKERARFAMIST